MPCPAEAGFSRASRSAALARSPRRIGRFRAFCLLAFAGLAPALLAGCGGPLSVNILLTGSHESLDYRLTSEGELSVTQRSGVVAGESGKPLYRTIIAPAEMERLKGVVQTSGFLVADLPLRASSVASPLYRVEVTLGLWANRMTFAGAIIPSLAPIVAELNRRLPDKHLIPYDPPAAGESDLPDPNDPIFEKYME